MSAVLLEGQRLRADDPVIDPTETPATLTDRISAIALRAHAPVWWWGAMGVSLSLLGIGVFATGWLFAFGISVFGNDWPVMWGYPIIAYVWWIGIASGGTFISAMFFLLRVRWRASLNRIAETMTLFCAACAGIYPILHLGRPWFFYWLFPYPNTMELWPQFKSPLVWDFVCIVAYVVSSVLFWYLGLLPDLASLRDRAGSRGRQVFYGVLALGFRGTARQWRHHRATYAVLAALMAPLVCSVHSVVGLDFAAAATVGWHSTQYPPFFVFGAVLSGFAAVLLLVLPLRRLLGLETLVTGRHVDVLCRLLLCSSLCVLYAYIVDAFGSFYGGDSAEIQNMLGRMAGPQAPVYWLTLLLNCGLPLLFCWRWARRAQPLIAVICAGVVIGMFLERFGIVAMQLARQPLPSSWGQFVPSVWDWALLAGTVGLFSTGFLLAVRLLPVVSLFEVRELIAEEHGT